MLKIQIKGLSDGTSSVELSEQTENIEGLFPEFFGEVTFSGTLQKVGNRFLVDGWLASAARLRCDVSTEMFNEQIRAKLAVHYVADTDLYHLHKNDVDPVQPYYIHEDESHLDITEEVRQELALNLPMKRIAPSYRDRKLEELYPFLNAAENDDSEQQGAEPVDERWAALKNITFQNKN